MASRQRILNQICAIWNGISLSGPSFRAPLCDATPEALAYGLANHWPSAGVVSAEAGIVLGSHGMGKESIMRNLAMLNQLWDGNTLTIDRKTTDSFTVRGRA